MDKSRFERGEYMEFMDAFLKAHPEVIEDQRRGWHYHWDPEKVRKDELGEDMKNVRPEDQQH